MPLIEIHNLRKIYKEGDVETPALRDISFSVVSGEFIAITGPSGSGKSTLLHILGLLDKQTEGTYFFEGKNVDAYTSEEVARMRNKKIGFVFQAFNLLPRTTALENVILPLMYSDVPRSAWDSMARKAIEAVGLSHRIDREPSELSGGERQRIAIARALINDPEIICADEPTGNLDSTSGKVVMEMIQRLSEKKGKTVLLITHETYTAEHAERIINIVDGKIESDSSVLDRHREGDHFKK